MRRLYTNVSVAPIAGGHAVLLDDSRLKTPGGHDVIVPTSRLAQAIAAEWQAQGKTVQPASMPMMQYTATTLDHTAPKHGEAVERVIAYLDSDLLCQRVPPSEVLHARQQKLWQPPLDWFAKRYDLSLAVTHDLVAMVQPPAARERVKHILDALNPWQMMGVQMAVLTSGSLVLGLALFEEALSPEQVFDAAELESTYQIEKWGEDTELAKRREEISHELQAVARWFSLIRP